MTKYHCKCWNCDKIQEVHKENGITYRCKKCGSDVTVELAIQLKKIKEAMNIDRD
jgi:Zn finger protein HypA/HybF involved in hydrogenase expression